MRGGRCALGLLATVACAASAFAAAPVSAQDDIQLVVRINYVYAAQFGFGAYEVGGLRVHVYSLPIQYTFEDLYRDWDLTLFLPVVYGRYQFRTFFDTEQGPVSAHASTNSLALAPRLQLDIPIIDGLRLSPIASWGFGSTFDTTGHADLGDTRVPTSNADHWFHTYQAGLSSLYRRQWHDFTAGIGAAVIWAGDNFFGGDDDTEDYGTFRTGVEGRHPLGFEIDGRKPDAGLYFVYDRFFPDLQFTRVGRADLQVDELFEIGATIGSASPLDLPWIGNMLDDLRIGAAYQVGNGLSGWRLSLGFPF